MAGILMVAAETGNIKGLYASIKAKPKVLDRIDDIPFVDTPLHTAASAGHTDFAIEILRLKPSFGRKLNPDGLSSLHLALINDKFDTVKRLIKFDEELIRVKGKEGITPLHFIAKKDINANQQQTVAAGRIDILAEFLFACANSIKDLTNRNETALHIALKTGNQTAALVILGCICRIGMTEVLAYRDVEGKNALAIAESTSQDEIAHRLRSAGALEILPPDPNLVEFLNSLERPLEKLYKRIIRVRRSMSMERRSIGLVVAVLIATATFQAVLSPPGGPAGNNNLLTNGTSINATTNHLFAANTSFINATFFIPTNPTPDDGDFFRVFYGYNTLAFVLSTLMIMFTLPIQPFFLLHVALYFQMLSYGVSFSVILPSSGFAEVFRQVSIGFAFIIYICRFVIDQIFLTGKPTNKLTNKRLRMLERLLKNN